MSERLPTGEINPGPRCQRQEICTRFLMLRWRCEKCKRAMTEEVIRLVLCFVTLAAWSWTEEALILIGVEWWVSLNRSLLNFPIMCRFWYQAGSPRKWTWNKLMSQIIIIFNKAATFWKVWKFWTVPVNFKKIQRGINSYSMGANFALCSKYRASKMRTKGCKKYNESFRLKCALCIKRLPGIADLHQKMFHCWKEAFTHC